MSKTSLYDSSMKNIMQVLEFCMEVAMTFLAQRDSDSSNFSELQKDQDVLVHGKKCSVTAVPNVSFCKRANALLPKVVNLKYAACYRACCSEKTRVQCVTCKVFLCLWADHTVTQSFTHRCKHVTMGKMFKVEALQCKWNFIYQAMFRNWNE